MQINSDKTPKLVVINPDLTKVKITVFIPEEKRKKIEKLNIAKILRLIVENDNFEDFQKELLNEKSSIEEKEEIKEGEYSEDENYFMLYGEDKGIVITPDQDKFIDSIISNADTDTVINLNPKFLTLPPSPRDVFPYVLGLDEKDKEIKSYVDKSGNIRDAHMGKIFKINISDDEFLLGIRVKKEILNAF